MQNMEEKEVKLCVRCKHVYGLAQFPEKGFPCRECFEQEHWEQKETTNEIKAEEKTVS